MMLTYICTNCGGMTITDGEASRCPGCDAELIDITCCPEKEVSQKVNLANFNRHHFAKWQGCRHYFDYGLKYDSKRVI